MNQCELDELIKIGNYMRGAREDQDLTQAELAKMAGIKEDNLQNYERGLHAPRIVTLIKLADALKIGIDEYVGRRIPWN